MNSLNIIGRLTRDPELKYAQSGTAICSFSIAFDIGWGDKKKSAFLDCTVFGKRAENAGQMLAKGHRVALNGSLDFQEWEKNGEKKSKFCMSVSDFTMLEKRADGQQAPKNDWAKPEPKAEKPAAFDDSLDEDNIPW